MKSTDNKEVNNETLSRLMDGEWQDLKAGECLAGVCKSESMKGAWERYHLIRDVIRNEPVAPATTLCDRISAAIADEPTYSNVHSIGSPVTTEVEPANSSISAVAEEPVAIASLASAPARSNGLQTAFKGFALAASVALVTVVGVSVWQDGSLPGADGVSSQVAQVSAGADGNGGAIDEVNDVFSQQVPGSSLPEVDFVSNTASYWVSPETTERSPSEGRLNMFLSQHIEHSPTAGHQGMFPYSRLVGYEQQVAE